jgi:O-antigen/teichoic acid export membrane protein
MQVQRVPKVQGHIIPKVINSFFVGTGMALVAGGVAAQGIGAVTGLLIARKIGPEGYGQYATAFALVNSFVFTFLFGLDSVVVREVARHPAKAGNLLTNAGLPVAVWSAGLVMFISMLGRMLAFSSEVLILVSIFAPATALRAMINLARAGIRGFERFGLDATIQILEAALALVFISALLGIYGTASIAAWGLFLSEIAALGFALFLIARVTRANAHFNWRLAKSLIKEAVPIGLTFTLLGINLRLEMVVLGVYTAETAIGKYAAALSIVMLSRSWSLVSAALLPKLSITYQQGLEAFLPTFVRGLGRITILASAIGLLIFFLAEPMLLSLFGPEYSDGADVLKILAVMGAVMFVNTYLWQALIAVNSQTRMALAMLILLAITGGLLFFFVPKFGIAGAAVASLGREFCQVILLSWLLFKRLL